MSDIKLGPSGAQVTLPDICWPQGAAPQLGYELDTGVQETKMLDGSSSFNITAKAAGTWTLNWDGLIWSEVETILSVVVLAEELVYTNGFTDNTNHDVVVTGYSYALKAETAASTPKYVVSVSLKEIA
jgi:hypothetical protein